MIRKLLHIPLLLTVLLTSTASAQSLYPVPIDEKIQESSLIIEGKVIEQHCFWNERHTSIFTSNKIEVYKVFKGAVNTTYIEVLTQGGHVGDISIHASDLLELEKDEIGVFFCFPNSINLRSPQTSNLLYDIWSSAQGCFKYDVYKQTASAPFVRYSSIEQEMYVHLQLKTGRRFEDKKPSFKVSDLRPNLQARPQVVNITSFTPSVVAGALADPANNVLTINGSGFTTPNATARIEFDNPDNGTGGTPTTVLSTSELVLSWTDAQIQVRVPAKVGTGTFTVYDNVGASQTSATNLDVRYAILNLTFGASPLERMLTLVNQDIASGGYVYFYSNVNGNGATDFSLAPEAAPFARAITTWREVRGLNFNFGGGIANQAVAPNNPADNTIMLDNTATGQPAMPSGTLAICYSSGNACIGDIKTMRLGFDIVVRNPGVSLGSTTFNNGPCNTTGSAIDMETVLLHELGHALNLGHINDSYQGAFLPNINPGKLMNFAVVNGSDRRSPDWSANQGAMFAINLKGYTFCGGFDEMTPLGGIINEAKDECPVTFPSTVTATNTVVPFDLVHATSNKNVDPGFQQFVDPLGIGIENTAYYAIRTKVGGGVLNITVGGYTTVPGSAAGSCPDAIELALYQVSTCPAGQAFPAPFATRSFSGNGSLATITGLASNANYLIVVDGFSNTKATFSLTLNGSALPIHLLSFTGRKENTTSVLEWQTGSEFNNAYFEIQTSKDGITYYSIGRVNSRGNSTTTQSYAFTDRLPITGANYYRLKQVDIDGNSTLSNIVLLSFTDKGRPMIVYPNPAVDNLTFEISKPSTNVQARILTTDGKLVKLEKPGAVQRTHDLDIASLSSGSYILEVTTDNNVVQYARFVKQ